MEGVRSEEITHADGKDDDQLISAMRTLLSPSTRESRTAVNLARPTARHFSGEAKTRFGH